METKSVIDHLSYSALRTYMTSPYNFWQSYVMKQPFTPNLSMIAGSAWHKGVEMFLRGDDNYILGALALLEKEGQTLLKDDYDGKMQEKLEKEAAILEKNLITYSQINREWQAGEHIEAKVSMPSPVENGLPITGIVDVINTNISPVDHKYIARFTTDSQEKYYVQAWFYYHITHNLTGEYPKYFIISEFKKSANRDKTSQLKDIIIPYDAKWIKKVDEWYVEVSQTILKSMYFPANPFRFDDISDWKEYLNS